MIVPVEIPADERTVPLDLTSPGSQEIGRIHSEFNMRAAYAITNAGLIESRLVELRRVSKLLRANFLIRHHDSDKKYERDAEAMTDSKIVNVEDEIAELEAKQKLVDAIIQSYVKIVEASSREISRRENERTRGGVD
jgi:hypothetical protein